VADTSCVRLEKDPTGIRTLILDKPPVNALGQELVAAIQGAADSLRDDEEARCLIVRSAGKHFCGGADLKERQGMSEEQVRAFVPKLARAVRAVAELPFPTIAAVRGAALGGGCELALACDLRVLSEDATIGLRETALAILPGAGGTQRLTRIAGTARAKRWIFTAKVHTAAEALADGVADRVSLPDRLHDDARALAESIAANGPVAIRAAKRAIERGFEMPMDRALDLEWECYTETIGTEDRLEALKAFAEKRSPRFRGR
jgi:enoyl-CoA hydratase/carnithine racemase